MKYRVYPILVKHCAMTSSLYTVCLVEEHSSGSVKNMKVSYMKHYTENKLPL
jgi:hypothetical protein